MFLTIWGLGVRRFGKNQSFGQKHIHASWSWWQTNSHVCWQTHREKAVFSCAEELSRMYVHHRDVRKISNDKKEEKHWLEDSYLVSLSHSSFSGSQSYKSGDSNRPISSLSFRRRRNHIWRCAANLCYFRVIYLWDLVALADEKIIARHTRNWCGEQLWHPSSA